ncbi:MAG: phosphatidylserine decarboxylase family protein [Rikenellaceae bacterium]|nr:phosphatidylserine decarboxylase family protein [Rikenellaceae bacterium]
MKINREGSGTILCVSAFLAVVAGLLTAFAPLSQIGLCILWGVTLVLLAIVVAFFREPLRPHVTDPDLVYAPCDGVVVVREDIMETEVCGQKMMQVSIFMSLFNVHINWFPVGGKVVYKQYHPGKFLVASHPKSSDDNERMTVGVQTEKGVTVIFRQIAGLIARRIVSYAKEGEIATQNYKSGFIKFGSRVDVYLPLDCEIMVNLGQKVVGSQTPIARLK